MMHADFDSLKAPKLLLYWRVRRGAKLPISYQKATPIPKHIIKVLEFLYPATFASDITKGNLST